MVIMGESTVSPTSEPEARSSHAYMVRTIIGQEGPDQSRGMAGLNVRLEPSSWRMRKETGYEHTAVNSSHDKNTSTLLKQ